MSDKRISHEEAREAMNAGMEEIGCDDSQFDAFRRLRAYIAQQESRETDGWISGWVDPTPNSEGVFRGYFGERAVGMPGLRRAAVRYLDGGDDE